MIRLSTLAATALLLSAGCRAYRPADPTHPRVEPVRVRFATPQTVVLRRQKPDSLLPDVSRLDGILVWSDADSLRIDVTGAQTSRGWRAVEAPSDAVIPMRPGTIIEHRVLSRLQTTALIVGAWAAIVVIIADFFLARALQYILNMPK